MNKLSKNMMAGALAATLVLGGAGYLHSNAFAASASDTSTSVTDESSSAQSDSSFERGGKRGGFGGMHGGMRGGNLMQETAEILNIAESVIRTELQSGKTFAQIAEANGLTKEEYLSKLEAAQTETIDGLLSAGTITQEQADTQKEGLADRLAQVIEMNKADFGGHGKGHGKGHGFGRFGNPEEIAALLGITADEVNEGMASGQSLAEIAAAKGITEADLIEKLKENMTDSLKEWVNEKRTALTSTPQTTEETSEETTSNAV
ncbi:hypothetical protein [Paenibacillus abyssi]|uniref:LysM domain-containing protein n=1 Tax=Paenibacillus abyssi TaxID=1340531 RepID=A0A917G066_9BACL|nr:hypothetical protein [Paenibacillus abyssi]GGG15883.1 hypothetical protein GCM10010916_36030 [Paenibacillus abyssi]